MAIESKQIKTEKASYWVLVEPWITEAATMAAQFNKYIFKVGRDANKVQIKASVENIYKVKVQSVNVINVIRKKRTRGRTVGWKSGFKKAIVTLKEGDKIEFFEGK